MNNSISIEHLQTRLAFLLEMDVSLQSPLVKGKLLDTDFDKDCFKLSLNEKPGIFN